MTKQCQSFHGLSIEQQQNRKITEALLPVELFPTS